MKKLYLFAMAGALCCAKLNAQATFQWGKVEGLFAYDYGYGINTDNSGNVYVAGKYEDTARFSGHTLPNQGNHDMYLVKYNSAGAFQWVRTAGGQYGDYAEALSTDHSHYLYVSGETEGQNGQYNISFIGSTITVTNKGDNDAFLAKYDLDGNLQWVVNEGDVNSEKGLGNAVDANGNVYMVGYFTDATKFGGNNYTSAGGRDIYVAKYNSSGQFQWFRKAGSSSRDEAKAAFCDASGNVYVCGVFNNNCAFDGGPTLKTFHETAYWDAFLAKYDPSGNLVWVKTAGGDVDDGAWAITMDNSGNVYIGGETAAYAEFSGVPVTAAGEADSFVAKYSSNGDLAWVKRAGSDKVDRIRGIGTDGTNVFATGQYGGTATFGFAPSITSVDTSDIFIAAISPAGDWIWASTIGGPVDAAETLGYESGNAVNATASGDVYATGGMLSGGTFGTANVAGYSRTDVFITKLSWNTSQPAPLGLASNDAKHLFSLYPNPANNAVRVDLTSVKDSEARVELYNSVGQRVCIKNCISGTVAELNLSDCTEGVYLVQVNGAAAGKIIVKH